MDDPLHPRDSAPELESHNKRSHAALLSRCPCRNASVPSLFHPTRIVSVAIQTRLATNQMVTMASQLAAKDHLVRSRGDRAFNPVHGPSATETASHGKVLSRIS